MRLNLSYSQAAQDITSTGSALSLVSTSVAVFGPSAVADVSSNLNWADRIKTEISKFKKSNSCSPSKPNASTNTLVNTGRGKNNIKPDLNAQGPHSVFKRDPLTGKITNYKTYKQNPKNPTGYDEFLGYDGVGKPHKNPVTGEDLMPHVHDKTVPGRVRSPYLHEIP